MFGGTVVVSDVLITRLSEHLTQLMPQKAKAAVERGAFKEQVSGSVYSTETKKWMNG